MLLHGVVPVAYPLWWLMCVRRGRLGWGHAVPAMGVPLAYCGVAMGRGLLTGDIQRFEDLAPSDRRRIHPRFKGENLQRNLALVRRMEAMAQPLGLSCAQLALAWAAAQGQDIVPLTGTQRLKYVEQGVAALALPLAATQCAELEAIFSPEAVSGERYPVEMLKDLGI